ncbi:1-deoxy-D-xylulose-5-phosphate synthase [Burkholderia cenocepacia]|uniref:1-deoxy-D-xylulose-5-phosphate synthase n=1 Tax=Burkholderia cenocepacia TaxID=95486 RepID=UPI001CF4BC0F|nr:1-deoxy-D-xylulose-5-phosphate synthase [Burkholderia cenocepacia]MCA7962435.1 1-deoxy-D-xylulose-5-phosphate synthase [Burkholderia cenocepacia]MDR8054379.1 1-deoxy-D-xylulose-5-phosphate synthase [Burkholderia cenocepacia]MDR8064822.1 1-deoxy-D-xylulose-5-phosphate synthase [Burkholderia cenocepacia]
MNALSAIYTPADLRKLARTQLPDLATQLRDFVLHGVAATGGHLASNLGSVELAIALHYVFDTPRDRIVWDVGHQSYPHKILTGRREAMKTLRQGGGISGFPRRSESPYDAFGTAHSSTSISAVLGMAHAARINGEARHCVAVIGDGALSAGIAFEAMNNLAGCKDLRLLVVLNDNDMSISPTVGALRDCFAKLTANRFLNRRKADAKSVLQAMPAPLAGAAHRLEAQVKGVLLPATLFEEFGFNYVGPIDGHDLDALIPALETMRTLKGPQLLHVITRKGRGYALAEKDPVLYHGPGKFDPDVGIVPPSPPGKPTYTQVFGNWLCDEAERDRRVVAITPAMREGSGLVDFERRFPDRYFDVGIAEQHAITFAGGLAADGLKPVVAIYSTFLQRGYDQLIHDIAIQRLPVTFAIDRAGIVGADGATHMGAFDIAFLRCIPDLVLMAPADENECRQMLHTALDHDGPAAVRYPRGCGPGVPPVREMQPIPIGKGAVIRTSSQPPGARIAILAFGSMVGAGLKAGKQLDATVANMRFIRPLDIDLVRTLADQHDVLVTVEEGCIAGGAGSACLEVLAAHRVPIPVLQLGLPDQFIEHGDPAMLLAACGLDVDGLVRSIDRFFNDVAASCRSPRTMTRMSLVS